MKDLSVEGLGMVYELPKGGSVQALDAVSFALEAGRLLTLLGPSGCGKTTLLNIIAGLESVDEGELLIDDYMVHRVEPKDRNIAMVFQSYALYPAMTVRENIIFGLKQRKISKEQTEKSLDHFSKMLQVDQLLERKPAQLSGGQRQRIAIARAILRDTPILVLDEATSALDSESEKLVQNALHKLMEHRTSFVIAHRLSKIKNASRIIVLDKGKIVEAGTHESLLRSSGLYQKYYEMQFIDL